AYVPIAVPLWSAKPPSSMPHLQRQCAYEASSLPAVALETAMLPCRLQGGPRPSRFIAALAPSNRPVCGILQAMPMPQSLPLVNGQAPGSNDTMALLAPHLYDLSCMPVLPQNPYTSVVLRGVDPRRLFHLTSRLPPPARANSFVHPAALPLPVPFPQVFAPQVSRRGLLVPGPAEAPLEWPTSGPGAQLRPSGEEVEACPVATQIHAMAGAGRCRALSRMAAAVKAHMHSGWSGAVRTRYGLEVDDFREVLDTITDHLECSAADASDDDEGSVSE
ncbi:unnamed protein product, partial [Polarella glacialis]